MATREKDFWNERAVPRIAAEHMGEILATAADLALIVGRSGTIHAVVTNPLNGSFGKIDHWHGRNISDFLAPDSQEKVLRRLGDIRENAAPAAIEVNHADGADWTAPMRYTLLPRGRMAVSSCWGATCAPWPNCSSASCARKPRSRRISKRSASTRPVFAY